MKKLLKILVLVILLVVIGGGIALYTQLNRVVKTTVETMGPKVLQAPVTLDEVNLSLFSGEGSLGGLTVGNPEGFKSDNAFVLGSLKVKLDPASLKTDTIRINEIVIDGAEITYEGLKGKNLKKLQENAEAFGKKPGEEEEPEEEEVATDKPRKKVIIDSLVFENGKINYSPAMGKIIPVPLPRMELTGIGEKSGGATGGQVLIQVLGQIDNAAIGAVANVGKLAGDVAGMGVGLAGGAAELGVGAVTDVSNAGAEAVGDAAKMGADAVGATAEAGTKAVTDVTKMGTDAIGGAADAGVSALKKIPGFGRGKDKEETPEPAEATAE